METEKQKARRKQWEECASLAKLAGNGKCPSAFALDLAEQEIRGEITVAEMRQKIREKYTVKQEKVNEHS